MATQLTRPEAETAPSGRPAPAHRAATALLVAAGIAAAGRRRGQRPPWCGRRSHPEPRGGGCPTPGRRAVGPHRLDHAPPDRDGRDDDRPRHGGGRDVAPPSAPPDPADGHRHDRAGLAGPDHELGAVRGLQPAALALARDLAARVPVAHRRAVPRDRVRHLLHGAVLPGGVDPAPPPGAPPARVVREPPPARHPGRAGPRHRLRVRRRARDVPRPHAALHLLAGRPVRVVRRGASRTSSR